MHVEASSPERVATASTADQAAGRRLIVICEDCGKKYRVEADKIRSRSATFTCRRCGHPIQVVRPLEAETAVPPSAERAAAGPAAGKARPAEHSGAPASAAGVQRREKARVVGFGRLGWRLKALGVFFLLPAVVLGLAGFAAQKLFEHRLFRLGQESRRIVDEMTEEGLASAARFLARQTALGLEARGRSAPSDGDGGEFFRLIALSAKPPAGSAFVYERPGPDGIWRGRAHSEGRWGDGVDLGALREDMGAHFDRFWELLTGVRHERESRGYCFGRDRQGRFREEFMVCHPVPDTPYVVGVASTLEENGDASVRLKTLFSEFKSDMRALAAYGMGAILGLVFAGVAFGGWKMAGRIPVELAGPDTGARRRRA